jgi:predicted permease
MLSTALAIAPVFVMILAGYALRRGGFPSTEFWNLNDRLVYWVLMPALFFRQISTADLTGAPLGPFAAVLCGGFLAATAFGWAVGRWAGYDAPLASTVMQASGRFNTFVGLAIAEALFGAEGLALAVLGAALLVPVVNVTVVTAMTLMLSEERARLPLTVLRDLAWNPLILSIALGAGANLSGLGGLPVIDETAALLGAAALPVMLLSVGANLKLRGLTASAGPLALSATGKLVVFPAATILLIAVVQPGLLPAEIALIYAALPTGVAAYTLARAMGGDAPTMAATITVQTLLSFFTIPLTLAVSAWLLAP